MIEQATSCRILPAGTMPAEQLVIRETTVGGAVFDRAMRHRYLLWRNLTSTAGDAHGENDSDGKGYRDSNGYSHGERERTICFIMLNPNRADEISNDPTIKRCIGFASGWGFLKVNVVNLFSVKAATPALLRQMKEPLVGPSNDAFVLAAIEKSSLVVAAWGNHGNIRGRDCEFLSLLNENGHGTSLSHETKLYCLGLTKLNQPRHPLYLRATLEPVRFFC